MDKWEEVETTGSSGYLNRIEVPGGWIYKQVDDVVTYFQQEGRGITEGYEWRSSICFVPFLEVKCETCEGHGWVKTDHNHWGTDPCPTCNGSGK